MTEQTIRSHDEAPDHWRDAARTVRRARTAFLVLALALAPLVLWQAAEFRYASAIQTLKAEAVQRLTVYRTNLVGELEKHSFLPEVLAQDGDFINLLAAPQNPTLRQHVNKRLETINALSRTSDTYLMGVSGTTIAASNWNTPTTFVGQNFSFRPYFQQAMKGQAGRYFALGTTSNKAGYYLSFPVETGGRRIGVVVVKVGVDRIEEDWAAAGERILVTDRDGIVFLTSRPEWRYRSLRPLPPDRRMAIMESRKYSDSTLDPLPLEKWQTDENDVNILHFSPGHEPADASGAHPNQFLMHTVSVPGFDWTLGILLNMQPARETVIEFVLIVTSTMTVGVLLVLFLMQRRVAFVDRLEIQARSRQALEEAYAELELRVRDRTTDLRESNERLQAEIAERLRAEDDLRTMQDELIQASKLAALGQMAAGITHELNQPLAAIRTYSDNAGVLMTRGRLDEAQGNLTRISELTARLARITAQLKVFARKTEPVLEPVSLGRAVAETLSLVSDGGKLKGVSVVNRVPEDGPWVLGGSVRLQQVLLNLINNALDAMEEMPQKTLQIEFVEQDQMIALTVTDSGSGLPEGDVRHLFDPFVTTKEVGKGLGLGLSVSYSIIRDFGGDIRAANREDADGAVFTVELKPAEPGHGRSAPQMIGVSAGGRP